MAINKAKIITEAQKYTQKGQYERAIKEYQKILSAEPNDTSSLQRIAELYKKMERFDDSIATYKRVAEIFSNEGFYNKAIAVYKQLAELHKKIGKETPEDILTNLASLYEQIGLLSEAYKIYKDLMDYYENKGELYEALAVLRKMTKIEPDNISMRLRLAEGLIRAGMREEGIDEYANLIEELAEAGREDEYIRVLERMLHHTPENNEKQRELAEIYLSRGEYRRALIRLQECIKLDPTDPKTLDVLARAFTALKQIEKACTVYVQLGQILEKKGLTEEALKAYKEALKLNPQHPSATLAHERLLKSGIAKPEFAPVEESPQPTKPTPEKVKQPPKSTPQPRPRQAVDQPPPQQQRHKPQPTRRSIGEIMQEARVLFRHELFDKVIPLAEEILEIDPNNRDALAMMRNAYVRQNKIEDARTVLLREILAAVKDGNRLLTQQLIESGLDLIPTDPLLNRLADELSMMTPRQVAALINDALEGREFESMQTDEYLEEEGMIEIDEEGDEFELEPLAAAVRSSDDGMAEDEDEMVVLSGAERFSDENVLFAEVAEQVDDMTPMEEESAEIFHGTGYVEEFGTEAEVPVEEAEEFVDDDPEVLFEPEVEDVTPVEEIEEIQPIEEEPEEELFVLEEEPLEMEDVSIEELEEILPTDGDEIHISEDFAPTPEEPSTNAEPEELEIEEIPVAPSEESIEVELDWEDAEESEVADTEVASIEMPIPESDAEDEVSIEEINLPDETREELPAEEVFAGAGDATLDALMAEAEASMSAQHEHSSAIDTTNEADIDIITPEPTMFEGEDEEADEDEEEFLRQLEAMQESQQELAEPSETPPENEIKPPPIPNKKKEKSAATPPPIPKKKKKSKEKEEETPSTDTPKPPPIPKKKKAKAKPQEKQAEKQAEPTPPPIPKKKKKPLREESAEQIMEAARDHVEAMEELPDLPQSAESISEMFSDSLFEGIETDEQIPDADDPIAEMVEEAEFFFEQGLFDECLEVIEEAEKISPNDERLANMKQQIRAQLKEKEVLPPQVSSQGRTAALLAEDIEDDSINLADEILGDLEDELADALFAGEEEESEANKPTEDDLLNSLMKEVPGKMTHQEYETHFNLGIDYKDMGLLDDAIEEFRICLSNRNMQAKALIMIGVCYIAKNELDTGAQILARAFKDIKEEERNKLAASMYFEIGSMYEDRAELEKSLRFFRKALELDPTYKNVQEKVMELVEEGIEPASDEDPIWDILGEAISTKNDDTQKKDGNNVSYV